MERPRGMNYVKTGGGRTLCTNCTLRKRTVRLGSLEGLYERFLLQPHRRECTAEGPSRILILCTGRSDSSVSSTLFN